MEAPKLLRTQYPGLMSTYHTPHICGQCGAHIGDDWSFCPECGMPTGLTQKDFEESGRMLDTIEAAGTCTPMDTKQMSRCARCRNHHYDMGQKQKFFCRLGHQNNFSMQEDKGECQDFKSRYLEFPLTIQGIEVRECLPPMRQVGKLVRVRPCGDENTYLGVYLGELARAPMVYTRSDSKQLFVSLYQNPAIFVPALSCIVWGDESWWSIIETENDLRDISNNDIASQWYVRLAGKMFSQGNKNNGEEEP